MQVLFHACESDGYIKLTVSLSPTHMTYDMPHTDF